MKNKCKKKKNTCLHIKPASCTSYEGYLSEDTTLDTCDTNIEETTEELYKKTESILEDIDIGDIEEECLDLVDKKANTVIKALVEEICNLKKELGKIKNATPCDIKINTEDCPLDLEGVEDECGEPMNNLNQLLTYLINKEDDRV